MCEGWVLEEVITGLRKVPLVISLLNSELFPGSMIKTSSWFKIQNDNTVPSIICQESSRIFVWSQLQFIQTATETSFFIWERLPLSIMTFSFSLWSPIMYSSFLSLYAGARFQDSAAVVWGFPIPKWYLV